MILLLVLSGFYSSNLISSKQPQTASCLVSSTSNANEPKDSMKKSGITVLMKKDLNVCVFNDSCYRRKKYKCDIIQFLSNGNDVTNFNVKRISLKGIWEGVHRGIVCSLFVMPTPSFDWNTDLTASGWHKIQRWRILLTYIYTHDIAAIRKLLRWHLHIEPLFIERTDVLPRDFVKTRNREIHV